MSRLQKKCLIATTGFHLLLVLTLVFGSAFFVSRSKPDDSQVLDVIPANVIDAAFNSGVKSAQPPAPTPPVIQPKPPQPTPEPPRPVVKPEPVKEPIHEAVKPVEKPAPKPPIHDIKPDLTPVIHKISHSTDTSAANTAREAKRLREQRAKEIANIASAIKNKASSPTEVEMPGNSSVSYANYASVVKSIYERAWIPPDDTANDDAITKVSVTIGRDGSVITSRILNPSGDKRVDASVQRTLDRVSFVAPFPDGAREKERTFIINFNLKAKRMLG